MLLPLGTYWPQDAAGYLVNPCSLDFLDANGRALAQATAQVYREALGDALRAVYLRGSAVRGTAIKGLSDWDSFAVVEWDSTLPFRRWEQPVWAAQAAVQLEARFPSVSKVELVVCDWAEAQPELNPRVRAMLKVESLLWEGENLAEQVPPFKADHPHLKRHLRWLEKDWQAFRQDHANTNSPESIRTFIKVLVRSAFELVMDREQRYAVDFFPCIQSFLKYHPEMEADFHQLVAIFSSPHGQKEALGALAKPLLDLVSSNTDSQSSPG